MLRLSVLDLSWAIHLVHGMQSDAPAAAASKEAEVKALQPIIEKYKITNDDVESKCSRRGLTMIARFRFHHDPAARGLFTHAGSVMEACHGRELGKHPSMRPIGIGISVGSSEGSASMLGLLGCWIYGALWTCVRQTHCLGCPWES